MVKKRGKKTGLLTVVKRQERATVKKLNKSLAHSAIGRRVLSFNHSKNRMRAALFTVAMLFTFTLLMRPVSAINTWEQTDWSGGIGSSTSNQYASATNIDSSTAGQLSLAKGSNLLSNSSFDTDLSSWNGVSNSHELSTTLSSPGSAKITAPAAGSTPFTITSNESHTQTDAWQMASGDFNDDNVSDLVFTGGSSNNITVRTSNGKGGWSTEDYATEAQFASNVLTSDFNNDGYDDIAVVFRSSTATFNVFMNDGDGTFTKNSYTGPTSRACNMAAGDFNDDTYVDLVITCYVWGSFSVYLNNGSGGFPSRTDYSGGLNSAWGQYNLATLDFNGDGYTDIALSTGASCAIRLLLNNAAVGFNDYVEYAITPCEGNSRAVYALEKMDLNGDQYDDIVFGYRAGSTAAGGDLRYVSTLAGNSSGTPSAQANYAALSGIHGANASIAVGDFNLDGHEDVIATSPTDHKYSIYLNNGDGTLGAKSDITVGTTPVDTNAADYNGDSRPDVAILNQGSKTVTVNTNNSSGSTLSQPVNTGDTDQYVIEGYAYTDGSAITDAQAVLYSNGASLSTTYTSAGGGWYKLSAVITGADEVRSYGVLAKHSITLYVDDVALYKYSTPGVLASNIYDLTFGGDWGNLTYTASGGGVEVKVRTSDSPTMSGAPDFSTCPTLSSGTDLTGQTCITNNEQYVQYQVTLTAVGGLSPVFEDITIEYAAWDTDVPTTNASNILMYNSDGGDSIAENDWTNASTPYFSWTAGEDNVGGSGIAGYCLYLGTSSTDNPATSKGILGTGPLDVSDACPFAIATSEINLATAGYIDTQLATDSDPYYLNVKAIDNAGNIFSGSSESFHFRFDNTPPTNPAFISGPSSFINTKEATFTWETSGGEAPSDDDSGVAGLQYRIGSGGTWYGDTHSGNQDASDLLDNDGSYTTQSTPDFADIQEGNNVIYFRTWDTAGNTSLATVTTVLKVNTSGAPSAPQNVSVTPTSNTSNSFAFSWIAPSSFVGQASNLTYCYTVNTQPTAQTCTFTTAGQTSLSAGPYATQPGTNTFYVVARDESSGINYATAASVEFTANTTAPGMPQNPDIADASVKSTSNWRLVISWEAPSDVGAGVSSYKVYRSTNNSTFTLAGSTSGTSYVDTGLSSQLYYYKLSACDSANNCGAYSSTVDETPTGRFTEPAEMTSSPRVSDIGTRKATIRWSTDRNSDSKIAFGTSSGNYQPTESYNSTQTTDHEIKLTSLSPGTTYYYQARWTDEDGNTGYSSEFAFETLPPPEVVDVTIASVGLTDATLQYTTVGANQVKIYYGKTADFGGLIKLNTSTNQTTYDSVLSELDDGSKYFFKVNTVDAGGNEYNGTTLTFTTPQAPRISDLRFQPVENEPSSTQKVTWTTNIPTTSEVSYGVNALNQTTAKDKLETAHEIVIRGLQDDSQYRLVARSRDANGNLATSDQQLFRTELDTRPPQVSDVVIDSTIRGTGAEARGQIVVSWRTDEPATSQVAYGEGSGEFLSSVSSEDTRLTYEHIVVISDLSTSKIYTVQPRSYDNARNLGSGENETAIISRATDNVLAIIFNALQQLFGLN